MPGNYINFAEYCCHYFPQVASLRNISNFARSDDTCSVAYARIAKVAFTSDCNYTVSNHTTLREEQQAISDAMKLRNVHGVFQKLEYIYVPLMLSASTTADELSQAITARGIDNPRPKTCAVSMQFHIQDYVLCFVAIVLVIIAFVLL